MMLARSAVLSLLLSSVPLSARAGDGGRDHDAAAHGAGVDHRGDGAMGFSHEKTAHHFGLTRTGGYISAESKDAKDTASRGAIVQHFHHIASAFKQGNFEMPMFIHGRVPPGVTEMKRLAAFISYSVEETPTGGRVLVTATDPEALDAVHRFLRFQIEDHRTGDSLEVQRL
jgi:hypothetical protein